MKPVVSVALQGKSRQRRWEERNREKVREDTKERVRRYREARRGVGR